MQRRWAAALALALSSGVLSGLSVQAATSPTGPGCDVRKTVVLHDGLGHRQPSRDRRPVVCEVQTGYQTSETRIAIGNDGTVVQFPALLPPDPGVATTGQATSGFAVSDDRGSTWSVHQVKLPLTGGAHPQWSSQDVNFFTDRLTGRIFASAPEVTDYAPNLATSDDNGRTWTTSRTLVGFAVENPNFVFAEPRTSRLSGYPHVVYFCQNLTTFGTSARVCAKSLDGGSSWDMVGQGFTGAAVLPAHPECGTAREEFSPGPEGYPVAAPDGSLYLVVSCGGKHFVARSTDEAATWPVVRDAAGKPRTIPYLDGRAGPLLRADRRGGLYVFSQVGNRLLLATSTDQGRSWSKEHDLVPPGRTGLDKWYAQVAAPGHVAVSLYAGRPETAELDAWLTESRDALSARPHFASGQVNDPARPALWTSRGNGPYPLLDFIGVDIGPDGTVWGSFVQDCGPNLGDGVACRGRLTYNNTGLVGRLAWPR